MIYSRHYFFAMILSLSLFCLHAETHAADLRGFQGMSWRERNANFYAWVGGSPVNKEKIKLFDASKRETVIDLLGFEDGWASGRSDLQEDYSDYFADLIYTVTLFKDRRAIPVLLRPGIIDTGDMVVEGLAQIGDPGAEAALARLPMTTPEHGRLALTLALGRMLERNTLKRKQREVQQALVALTTDKDAFVQAAAARGLGYADKEVALPALQTLATRNIGPRAEGAAQNSLIQEEVRVAMERLQKARD